MLSFAPPAKGEPVSVVDTFERTSNEQIRAFREKLQKAYEEDRGRSQIRDLLDRFEGLNSVLNDLYYVHDDWNSYGSPSPSKPAIEISRRILNSLWSERLLPNRAFPSADGGVALVFWSDTDNRAVIETLNDDATYLLLYDRQGNSKTLTWTDASQEKTDLLKQLDLHLKGAPLASV